MDKQHHIYDYGLIFLSRAIRSFFTGVFALILMENLINKGLSFADITHIQMFVMVGYVFSSRILIKKLKSLGVVNSLMIASFCRGIAGLVFAHVKSQNVISAAALFGIATIYGEWFCPFATIEKTGFMQLAKKQANTQEEYMNQLQRLFDGHRVIGYLFQGLGALFAGMSYHYGFFNFDITFEESGEKLLGYYAISAFVCLLIYALMDRYKIEPDLEDIDGEMHNEGWFVLVISVLYCLEGASVSLFSQSYIGYFFRFRHGTIYSDIGIIFAVSGVCKIVGFIFYNKFGHKINGIVLFLLTSVLPNILLLLFCMFFSTVLLAFIILFINSLLGGAFSTDKQKIIHKLFPGARRSSISWLAVAGFLIGGLLGFKLQQDHRRDFGAPAFKAGVIRLVIDLIIIICYRCRNVEIGQFNNLLRGELPIISKSRKIVSLDVI